MTDALILPQSFFGTTTADCTLSVGSSFATALCSQTAHSIRGNIIIENYTKWNFMTVRAGSRKGYIGSIMGNLRSGYKEIMYVHNKWPTATGCMGVVRFEADSPTLAGRNQVDVMWNLPFNFTFYSNTLAIFIGSNGSQDLDKLASDMNRRDEYQKFRRKFTDNHVPLTVRGDNLVVRGMMGSSHVTSVTIAIFPIDCNNLCESLLSKITQEDLNGMILASTKGERPREAVERELFLACYEGATHRARSILLNETADINAAHKKMKHGEIKVSGGTLICSADSMTCLMYAAYNGNVNTVRMLIDEFSEVINVNQADQNNNTALHWAAYSGHLDVVKILCERGCADLEIENNYVPLEVGAIIVKSTPLAIASKHGHYEIVRYLLQQGARVTKTYPDGVVESPALILANGDNIKKLLRDYGAKENEICNLQ